MSQALASDELPRPLDDLHEVLRMIHGEVRLVGWQGVGLPMVEACPRLCGNASSRPRQRRARLDRLVGRFVEVPDTLEHCAEDGIGLERATHELVVILELLPSHEAGWIATLASTKCNRVLDRLDKFLQDLIRLPGPIRDLRVTGWIVSLDHAIEVDQTLRVGVQAAKCCTDRGTALWVEGLILQRLQELVVSNLAWGERLLEELEDLADLHILHGATALHGEMLCQDMVEGFLVDNPRVLWVDLAEGACQSDDGPGSLAVQETLHPHETLLRPLPSLLLGLLRPSLRAEGHVRAGAAADAADEFDSKLLVVEAAVWRIAVEDEANILVKDARGERRERALEFVEVDPAGLP
mmetsp:Transcript_123382/g.308242  ORF Transcript_123382/g.308242 Transcript_123382/m.308242 type:complete len:352 (+) Transcript_123382:1674-2729(+)